MEEQPLSGGNMGGAVRVGASPAQIEQRVQVFLNAYAGHSVQLRYPASALLGHVPPRLIAMADWCDRQGDEELRRSGVTFRAHAAWISAGARGPADVVEVRDT